MIVIPKGPGPEKDCAGKGSSMYKWQTRPLVREGAPQKQDRNCQTVINIWSWAADGARHRDLLTDWPSVSMWLWLWLLPTTVQVTVVSEWQNKLRHNMLQKLTLTVVVCISCIKVVYYSEVTKHVRCPWSKTTVARTLRGCEYIHVKLRSRKYRAYAGRQTPPLVEEETPFLNT
jgi:hypothetical protein